MAPNLTHRPPPRPDPLVVYESRTAFRQAGAGERVIAPALAAAGFGALVGYGLWSAGVVPSGTVWVLAGVLGFGGLALALGVYDNRTHEVQRWVQQDEEPDPAAPRAVTIIEGSQSRQVQLAPLHIGGRAFSAAELEAIARTGERLTREAYAWTGGEYRRVTSALMRAGLLVPLGRSYVWTRAGDEWLAGLLSPPPRMPRPPSPVDDDDDDDADDGAKGRGG